VILGDGSAADSVVVHEGYFHNHIIQSEHGVHAMVLGKAGEALLGLALGAEAGCLVLKARLAAVVGSGRIWNGATGDIDILQDDEIQDREVVARVAFVAAVVIVINNSCGDGSRDARGRKDGDSSGEVQEGSRVAEETDTEVLGDRRPDRSCGDFNFTLGARRGAEDGRRGRKDVNEHVGVKNVDRVPVRNVDGQRRDREHIATLK